MNIECAHEGLAGKSGYCYQCRQGVPAPPSDASTSDTNSAHFAQSASIWNVVACLCVALGVYGGWSVWGIDRESAGLILMGASQVGIVISVLAAKPTRKEEPKQS